MIGGDDSNTNAAVLAEYFLERGERAPGGAGVGGTAAAAAAAGAAAFLELSAAVC